MAEAEVEKLKQELAQARASAKAQLEAADADFRAE